MILSGRANRYIMGLKWEGLSLILLFLFSLTLRLYLLFEFSHVVFLGEADGVAYFAIAKSILSSWGLGDTSLHYPPFYPFVVAVASLFYGDLEIAGRLASCIMDALLVFPVYFIATELYDRSAGFLSAITVVFFGAFVDYSLQPITQTTYVTLLTTVIYLGIALIRVESILISFLLGITLGALYLTRPEGIILFVYIGSLVSLSALFNKGIETKRKVIIILAILLGFSILALPYIEYLHKHFGVWTISGKTTGGGSVLGVDKAAKLLPSGMTLGETMMGRVELSDSFSIKVYWDTMMKYKDVLLRYFPIAYIIPTIIGLLATLGVAFKDKGDLKEIKRTRILKVLASFGGIVAVLPVFVFGNISIVISYILPLVPLMIIWLTIGLITIESGIIKILVLTGIERIGKLRNWYLLTVAILLFFSYSSLMPFWKGISGNDFKYYAASQKFFLKDTGKWLKSKSAKDKAVMARWSVITFYADRKFVMLPDGDLNEVIRYAKEHNVSHIVIDSNAVPRRPKLAPLLNPSSYPGLRPVYAKEEYWTRVIIYEVL